MSKMFKNKRSCKRAGQILLVLSVLLFSLAVIFNERTLADSINAKSGEANVFYFMIQISILLGITAITLFVLAYNPKSKD